MRTIVQIYRWQAESAKFLLHRSGTTRMKTLLGPSPCAGCLWKCFFFLRPGALQKASVAAVPLLGPGAVFLGDLASYSHDTATGASFTSPHHNEPRSAFKQENTPEDPCGATLWSVPLWSARIIKECPFRWRRLTEVPHGFFGPHGFVDTRTLSRLPSDRTIGLGGCVDGAFLPPLRNVRSFSCATLRWFFVIGPNITVEFRQREDLRASNGNIITVVAELLSVIQKSFSHPSFHDEQACAGNFRHGTHAHELPEGTIITVVAERFRFPEVLFIPRFIVRQLRAKSCDKVLTPTLFQTATTLLSLLKALMCCPGCFRPSSNPDILDDGRLAALS